MDTSAYESKTKTTENPLQKAQAEDLSIIFPQY